MLIAVISDTHLKNAPVPDRVMESIGEVEIILHAGDIVEMAVLDQLSALGTTYAVRGNMDSGDVAGALPEKRVVEVEGFKIGLIHGSGSPDGMIDWVGMQFGDVDCIVFGHTHVPLIRNEGGILFFNPGSPTDKIFTEKNSIGFLEVTDRITPRLAYVGDR